MNLSRETVESELLPQLAIESVDPDDPVVVRQIPEPWEVMGAGNYAAVFAHPNDRDRVVKVYAPGRPGLAEEVEVYRRLGSHQAYSQCFEAGENFLILQRLSGVTFYDCIARGIEIPKQAIADIDAALDYARECGLRPHDVHGRNVMVKEGRGIVVDVSDFLHEEPDSMWEDLKAAYERFYPLWSALNLRVPYFLLDLLRASYRFYRRRIKGES